MMRLKTASLAILGTAAIVISVLASPAMAEGKMAKDTMAKGTIAKGTVAKSAKYSQAQAKGDQTLGKGQRHVQRQATYRSQRIRNANAALPGGKVYRRPAGPGEVAGNVVGWRRRDRGGDCNCPLPSLRQ